MAQPDNGLMISAETINRIMRFHGDGLPVVSLYLPVNPAGGLTEVRSRIDSLVDDQLEPLARDDSTEHDWRLSLRGDIQRIKERLGETHLPPRGTAIFSCSARDFYEEVPLPRPVRDRAVVDDTPYVRPMLAVLDECDRSCVVVIDEKSARVWEHYLDDMQELTKVRDRVLRKPNYAGALGTEYRVRNKQDELIKKHYRHVSGILDELVRTSRFDLLIVGGHDHEVPVFLEFLPHDLRERVAGTFTIDPNPSAAPLAEIRASVDSIVERYEREAGRRLLAEVLDRYEAGGFATAGLDNCLWAASVAAIQTLLVREGAAVPGVVCDQSGWLALQGDTCPLSGDPTRPTPDVINDLVQAVIDEGGSIRHIEGDTKLDEYKVAAALRFPLPPKDAPSS
jgi:peptide chain release factor subunit 1